jgi:purine-binding chemotaxis protein CheW
MSAKKKGDGTDRPDENETPGGPDRVLLFADRLRAQQPAPKAEEAQELEEWLLMRVARGVFGLPIDQVQEVLRVDRVTRVPHAPHPVRGVTNLRGHVLPVVDLRVRLGLEAIDIGVDHRIVVVLSKGRLIGLLVDAVDEVGTIDRLKIEEPPADVMTERSYHIIGVVQRHDQLVILLDADSVLQVRDVDDRAIEP